MYEPSSFRALAVSTPWQFQGGFKKNKKIKKIK